MLSPSSSAAEEAADDDDEGRAEISVGAVTGRRRDDEDDADDADDEKVGGSCKSAGFETG